MLSTPYFAVEDENFSYPDPGDISLHRARPAFLRLVRADLPDRHHGHLRQRRTRGPGGVPQEDGADLGSTPERR